MEKIQKIPSHIPVSDAHLSRPSPIDLINFFKKIRVNFFQSECHLIELKFTKNSNQFRSTSARTPLDETNI